MSFRPETPYPDLDRLKAIVNTSDLQTKDNALYQVITQLIDAVKQSQSKTISVTGSHAGSVSTLKDADYLTFSDESADLNNSRQLIAGAGITFDDTVVNQRIINGGASSGYWTLLTDGDPLETEFIFADGAPISVFVPL